MNRTPYSAPSPWWPALCLLGASCATAQWEGSPAKDILTGEGRADRHALRVAGSVYDSSATKRPGEPWLTADCQADSIGLEWFREDLWSWTADLDAREYANKNGTELRLGTRRYIHPTGLLMPYLYGDLGYGFFSSEFDSDWVSAGIGGGVKAFVSPTVAVELGVAFERFLLGPELDPFAENYDARCFFVELGIGFHF